MRARSIKFTKVSVESLLNQANEVVAKEGIPIGSLFACSTHSESLGVKKNGEEIDANAGV